LAWLQWPRKCCTKLLTTSWLPASVARATAAAVASSANVVERFFMLVSPPMLICLGWAYKFGSGGTPSAWSGVCKPRAMVLA